MRISFYFFFTLVLFLLLDTSGMTIYLLLAVVLHELGHIVAMACHGMGVSLLELSPFGLRLIRRQSRMISPGGEITISLAGSVVNLIAGGLAWHFCPGRFGLLFGSASMVLGAFNLLPVQGLDGGRILTEALEYFFGQRAHRTAELVSLLLLACLCVLAAWLFLTRRTNPSLLVLLAYLLLHQLKGRP